MMAAGIRTDALLPHFFTVRRMADLLRIFNVDTLRQSQALYNPTDRLVESRGRFNWALHAYCLMTNHYHLLVETPDGNLAKGMRELNGLYTQGFNRVYGRTGHVFQGRYNAILVQKEAYLLEVARYIVLNPVRARMVRSAGDYPWSSYRAMTGEEAAPEWLETRTILAAFGPTEAEASEGYRSFVAAGKGQPTPWEYAMQANYIHCP